MSLVVACCLCKKRFDVGDRLVEHVRTSHVLTGNRSDWWNCGTCAYQCDSHAEMLAHWLKKNHPPDVGMSSQQRVAEIVERSVSNREIDSSRSAKPIEVIDLEEEDEWKEAETGSKSSLVVQKKGQVKNKKKYAEERNVGTGNVTRNSAENQTASKSKKEKMNFRKGFPISSRTRSANKSEMLVERHGWKIGRRSSMQKEQAPGNAKIRQCKVSTAMLEKDKQISCSSTGKKKGRVSVQKRKLTKGLVRNAEAPTTSSTQKKDRMKCKCQKCARVLSLFSTCNLMCHVYHVHGKFNQWKCPVCAKRSQSKTNAAQHIRNVHGGAAEAQFSIEGSREAFNEKAKKLAEECFPGHRFLKNKKAILSS